MALENNETAYDMSEPEKADLIPDGVYEAILSKAEEKASKSGNLYLSLEFTIREDVEQGSKGRKFWQYVFHSKSEPKKYDMHILRQIVKSQEGQPNYTEKFSSNDELLQFINKVYLRVTVAHEDEKDNFPAKNILAKKDGCLKSEKAPKTLPSSDKAKESTDTAKGSDIDLDDKDLPF